MRRRLDTLASRTILLLLLGIGIVHVASLYAYQHALTSEVTLANEAHLAERLLTLRRSLMRLAPHERESVAHELSGGPVEAHWSAADKAVPGGGGLRHWEGLARQLAEQGQDLAASEIIIGSSDPHVALVSLRLPDGSWLNVTLFSTQSRPQSGQGAGHGTVLSTSLMALGVVVVSVFVVGWLTRPLRQFAQAARALYSGTDHVPLAEEGPREVRALATAFNEMQGRIRTLIDTRTQTLLAVSHDLKTPLTRLRLRAEALPQAEATRIIGDIREMERMLDQTLTHLRGEREAEALRPLDVVSMLQTLVDDASDAGAAAGLEAPASVVLAARPMALKRAFANLIDNAIKYGGAARVRLLETPEAIVVEIADDGPGIPEAQQAAVFEPFVRLEVSRSRETGGFGLGLAIAKSGIEAHGGHVALANAPEGGLLVRVSLPKPEPAQA